MAGILRAISSAVDAVCESIDSSNKIWVVVNQPSFVGGDVVSGSVEMDCLVPFFARGVLLKLKGFERVWWQYQENEWQGEGQNRKSVTVTKEHKENKEFFKQTIVVYPHQGTVNPGHYSFPFQYQLPLNLPGTYCEEGGKKENGNGYHAKILYKCKATVDVAFRHDLHTSVRLVVNEKFEDVVRPSYAENKKTFLLTKGELGARVWLDKNVYMPGETIIAKMKANNTSVKPTRVIRIKMRHVLDMHAHGRHKEIVRTDYTREYAGFSPCFYGIRWMLFNIPTNLVRPSSLKGNHVRSSHFFEIECDIPGATDLCVQLPVLILAPQFLWSTVPPQPTGAPIPPDVCIRAPWQDDDEVTKCNNCNVNFSLFKRRHHCRHCSRVFCHDCCETEMVIPKLKYNEPVRVCKNCIPSAQAGGVKYQSTKKVMAEWQATMLGKPQEVVYNGASLSPPTPAPVY